MHVSTDSINLFTATSGTGHFPGIDIINKLQRTLPKLLLHHKGIA